MIYSYKRRYIIGIVCLIMVAIGITYHLFSTKKPQYIFHKTVNSIVEVKASDKKQKSFGTAIFVGKQKYLVTNAHVVVHKKNNRTVPYESIEIRFANESKYEEVYVKSFNEKKDIALLGTEVNHKVEGIETADSDKIDFGDTVYAIGNSMNYGISISQGIISIPKVEIEYNETVKLMIQADITISAGNSGGALLDKKGKLIGITTFRTKDEEGNIVYGNAYAIPINDVLSYADNFR